MNPPPFLTKDQVLYIHEQQLIAYGGQEGIRAPDLLDSALAVPQGGFGDTYFHSFPYGMAAAYAYHIAENQPFVDGNKRTAVVAALSFLDAYGIDLNDEAGALYDAMKAIGTKTLSKDRLEKLLTKLGSKDR